MICNNKKALEQKTNTLKEKFTKIITAAIKTQRGKQQEYLIIIIIGNLHRSMVHLRDGVQHSSQFYINLHHSSTSSAAYRRSQPAGRYTNFKNG